MMVCTRHFDDPDESCVWCALTADGAAKERWRRVQSAHRGDRTVCGTFLPNGTQMCTFDTDHSGPHEQEMSHPGRIGS